MKCISCGKEIPAGNVYCPICGKEAQIISDKSVLEDDLLKVLMETEELSPQEDDEYDNYEQEQRFAEEKELRRKRKMELQKKKQKQRMLLIILIVAICVAAFAVVFVLRKNSSYDSLYKKAEVSYHTGKYEDAIEYAVKALDKNPDSVDAYLLLGDIYIQTEEPDQAESCYMKVLDIDSANRSAYEKLLQMYSGADDYGAIQTLYATLPDGDESLQKLFDPYLIPAPEVNVSGGEYTEVLEIELSAKKGLEIYYTLDGTTPSAEKEHYEKAFKIKEQGETVLRAICVDENGNESTILEETYVLTFEAPDKPEVTPDGGTITSKTEVSVYVQKGTTAYYTWDGSTPNKSSNKYQGPIEIPEGNNILSVIAIDNTTGEKSEVFKTNFIYYPETTEEPEE